MPSFANTMAFDFTYLQTCQANSRSSSSVAEGARFVTTLSPSRATMPVSRPCSSRPPFRLRISTRVLPGASPPVTSRRTFSFRAQASRASGSTEGATITSTNCRSTMVRAVSPSSGRLKAMMPPKAEVGSVRNARS